MFFQIRKPTPSLLLTILTHILTIASLPPSNFLSPLSPHPPLANLNLPASLSPHLSPSAQILLPPSPEFTTHLTRWSSNPNLNSPTPSAIIIPATESDLSATIRFCNAHHLPFLATAGGHGINSHLADLKGGVVIDMVRFNKLEVVDPDKGVAVMGGGLLAGEVVRGLWKEGWQTTTGICACVGAVAPALGGGLGFLLGQYGLGADQIVGVRLVLGSGEIVEVDEQHRGDLFWGVRGAGHNFGVVSEMRYRVYKVAEGRRTWAWEKFTFTGERLEEVYDLANAMMERQPANMAHWSGWNLDVTVDPVKVSL
jgi:FAD/FMN-containing dehydrogenase